MENTPSTERALGSPELNSFGGRPGNRGRLADLYPSAITWAFIASSAALKACS